MHIIYVNISVVETVVSFVQQLIKPVGDGRRREAEKMCA